MEREKRTLADLYKELTEAAAAPNSVEPTLAEEVKTLVVGFTIAAVVMLFICWVV